MVSNTATCWTLNRNTIFSQPHNLFSHIELNMPSTLRSQVSCIFLLSYVTATWSNQSLMERSVTVQKARDPIASEKQIVFIRQLQNTVEVRWAGSAGADSKHSGGADIPAVQSLQLGQRYTETRPGENSFRTWKTDTESKYTTTVKTIWQRTTETPARYRQCRRATPVTVLIT